MIFITPTTTVVSFLNHFTTFFILLSLESFNTSNSNHWRFLKKFLMNFIIHNSNFPNVFKNSNDFSHIIFFVLFVTKSSSSPTEKNLNFSDIFLFGINTVIQKRIYFRFRIKSKKFWKLFKVICSQNRNFFTEFYIWINLCGFNW